MDQQVEAVLDQDRVVILEFLERKGGYCTMLEIMEACTNFEDGSALAKLLFNMKEDGLLDRRMGSKVGRNHRTMFEYAHPSSVNSKVVPVQEILAQASHGQSGLGLKGFDAALAGITKRLEHINIQDYDNKLKVLQKLGHVLDDPIAGLLKAIAKDLETVHRVHG